MKVARITVDTNVLVRSVIMDDAAQGASARKIMETAELIAIPVAVLCEFVWVLSRVYQISNEEIATAIRVLINAENVTVNHSVVESGLTLLDAGGDFADGAIASEGKLMGCEIFVSFDKKAIALLSKIWKENAAFGIASVLYPQPLNNQ